MNHKKQLERCLNRKISDRTYFRIQRVMRENDLSITRDNLKNVAAIKTECRKHRIPLEIGLLYYLKIANIQTQTLTGKKLFEYVEFVTQYKPHRITITRWFEGGYKPEKIYNSVEVSKIMLNTFLYNIRRRNNGTQQKSNRSSKISAKKVECSQQL